MNNVLSLSNRASASFPPLLGPFTLRTGAYAALFFRSPQLEGAFPDNDTVRDVSHSSGLVSWTSTAFRREAGQFPTGVMEVVAMCAAETYAEHPAAMGYAVRSAKSARAASSRGGFVSRSQAVKANTLAVAMALSWARADFAASVIAVEWPGTGSLLTAKRR
jgi:hypothetical protein